jgi:hypothetical protein
MLTIRGTINWVYPLGNRKTKLIRIIGCYAFLWDLSEIDKPGQMCVDELEIFETPSDVVCKILEKIRPIKRVYLKLSEYPKDPSVLMAKCSSASIVIWSVPFSS